MKEIFLMILFLSTVSSCGRDRQIENYGDITVGPGGIVLSNIEEHRGGWKRNECLLCHNVNLNVHRSSGSAIDPDELNKRVRANQGSRFCLTCHGTNGAE